jgi:hypothetical protein
MIMPRTCVTTTDQSGRKLVIMSVQGRIALITSSCRSRSVTGPATGPQFLTMDVTGQPGQRRSLGETDSRAGEQPAAADYPADSGRSADRAREPAALLDALRQRLEQLPENHPSEPGWAERERPPDGQEADAGRSRDSAGADSQAPDSQAPDSLPPDSLPPDSGEADPGEAASAEPDSAGDPDKARTAPEPGGRGQDRGNGGKDWLNAGQTRPTELYRPWFTEGEAGAPWFAAEPESG